MAFFSPSLALPCWVPRVCTSWSSRALPLPPALMTVPSSEGGVADGRPDVAASVREAAGQWVRVVGGDGGHAKPSFRVRMLRAMPRVVSMRDCSMELELVADVANEVLHLLHHVAGLLHLGLVRLGACFQLGLVGVVPGGLLLHDGVQHLSGGARHLAGACRRC